MSCNCECRTISMDQIGDIINQNYRVFIEDNWNWIKKDLSILPNMDEVEDDSDYDSQIFFRIHKDTLNVDISTIGSSSDGETPTEYWTGRAAITVFKDTTKQTVLEFDCADMSHYYDADHELWDISHLVFNGWYVPVTNVYGVRQLENDIEISFKPRDLFKKLTTEIIAKDCLKSLEDHLDDKILIFRLLTV